ncbi:calcium and integrin-binding protein 1-like isoform X2 [Hyposmocoma kahamanoa]|nr:calcium and integrin-binding protein 1-like isoform X2 [Hyposmocoma kahamanoa]
MKKFYSISPEKLKANYNHRFSKEEILQKFDVLRNNPFQDRFFKVFSSKKDGHFSFEDILDLASAMSPDCSLEAKAEWAFKLYDLDEDNQISERDITEIIDRITCDPNCYNRYLDNELKKKIANIILEELKLDSTGSIGLIEFKIMMSRIPEFVSSFYFRL